MPRTAPARRRRAGLRQRTEDFDGEPRFNDQQLDIGAFENQNALFRDGYEQTFWEGTFGRTLPMSLVPQRVHRARAGGA